MTLVRVESGERCLEERDLADGERFSIYANGKTIRSVEVVNGHVVIEVDERRVLDIDIQCDESEPSYVIPPATLDKGVG